MTVGEPTGSRQRNLSPWAHWQLHLESVRAEHPVPEDLAAIPGWRARVRGRLTDLLGAFPPPVAPDVEVLEAVDCGRYVRERVVFDSEGTMSVPAYLLVPNDRAEAGAAVLAVHGHGPGKAEVCGLAEAVGAGAVDEHHADYAHQLAQRGYVVLAPDLRGFGERADWQPDDRYFCDLNLVHATMAGLNPLTQNLHDLVCALDVLEQHPLVDPERLGAVGFSYGATMSLLLAAWDPRVRACVVSGYFSSWRAAHRVPWNMCGSQVLPGMLGRLEHVDLGALVAPRPMLVETGVDDLLFPVDAAREAVADLHRVYEAMHAPADALHHEAFSGGHRWHGEQAYPFLERWL